MNTKSISLMLCALFSLQTYAAEVHGFSAACYHDKRLEAQALIDHCGVNHVTKNHTPLLRAISDHNLAIVQYCLKQPNIDVNMVCGGRTALISALSSPPAWNCFTEELLKHPSIDVNKADHLGRTPLGMVINWLAYLNPNVKEHQHQMKYQSLLCRSAMLLQATSIDPNIQSNFYYPKPANPPQNLSPLSFVVNIRRIDLITLLFKNSKLEKDAINWQEEAQKAARELSDSDEKCDNEPTRNDLERFAQSCQDQHRLQQEQPRRPDQFYHVTQCDLMDSTDDEWTVIELEDIDEVSEDEVQRIQKGVNDIHIAQ